MNREINFNEFPVSDDLYICIANNREIIRVSSTNQIYLQSAHRDCIRRKSYIVKKNIKKKICPVTCCLVTDFDIWLVVLPTVNQLTIDNTTYKK